MNSDLDPADEPEDDYADEYEPNPYEGGFVGCEDFNEEDLWE
jgi:hypothetical protein